MTLLALAALLPMQDGDPMEDMQEIFRRPEFDRSPSWWDRTWTAIGDFFGSLSFSWLGPVGQFLLWLLLIAGVVAIGVAIWRLWRDRGPRRRRKKAKGDDDLVPIDLDDLTDPVDVAARRAVFEEARDYKQAILYRYREAVLHLMQWRVVSTEPGRTTGELRVDLLGTRPDLYPAFDRASGIFEVTWYSDHDSTRQEFEELDTLVSSVIAPLVQPSTPPFAQPQVPA